MVEIIIKSPHPLTDDQWHQVIAERNVKEASLQVDQFPREIQKAPTEGHTRLELYSQLYVGAAAYDGPFCSKDVGAFFEEGMWLQYNFSSVGNNMKDSGSKTPLSSKESENFVSDLSLNKEEISFSFSTSKAPCILLYISAYSQDYMAVLVNPAGSLQVRYKLGGAKEPYNINVDHRNMSNGQPHSVNITRAGKDIILQLDLYPPVSYTIPGPSSLQFSSLKSLFLGKVIERGHAHAQGCTWGCRLTFPAVLGLGWAELGVEPPCRFFPHGHQEPPPHLLLILGQLPLSSSLQPVPSQPGAPGSLPSGSLSFSPPPDWG
ncbi:contactin-associated protein-like 2 [Crotalus adamanteus]|uniref:Contactin-associated protein-like 2 n=1 Tax=Crotalus adamanteus TaxID=8729 RepID=A0AAW1B519_CROAD